MTDQKITEETDRLSKDLLHVRLLWILDSLSGFVHNISNPLTFITTKAQLLEMKMPQNSDFPKMVIQAKNIESMLDNISVISQNLADREIGYLNALLKNEFEYYLTDPFYKHKIEKNFSWSPQLPRIKFSYFDVSTLVFCIMQILLNRMRKANKQALLIKTDKTDTAVIVQLSASCAPFSAEIAKAISAADSSRLPQADSALQNLAKAVQIANGSGISLTITCESEQSHFIISIPIAESKA
jgi:nitrogen-specific signal transduction histidine kinase